MLMLHVCYTYAYVTRVIHLNLWYTETYLPRVLHACWHDLLQQLVPDAPELIQNYLESEQDPSCKRNAFIMLIHTDQQKALQYLQSCIDDIGSFGKRNTKPSAWIYTSYLFLVLPLQIDISYTFKCGCVVECSYAF